MERWHLSEGAALIEQERERQIKSEGYTAEHDDGHDDGVLADAAQAYISTACVQIDGQVEEAGGIDIPDDIWPFDLEMWKPGEEPIRNLVKAGALIAAEIDRLKRKASQGNLPAGEVK